MAALTFVGSPLGPGLGTADLRVPTFGRHAPWEAVATKTAWKPCSTTGGGGGGGFAKGEGSSEVTG